MFNKSPANPSTSPELATGLFDVSRLAELLGVKPASIRSMRKRGGLPEPTASLNGGAVWSAQVVREFYNLDARRGSSNQIDESLPSVIDLFSGCGGLSTGFQQVGFDVLAGYDNWQCAVNTYRANLDHEAGLLDLGDVEATILELEKFEREGQLFPAIIGGPPCQDFSSAGKRQEGSRADLTEKFAAIVKRFQPPFFVMENVPRAEKSAAYNRALDVLRGAGYEVVTKVLDASLCGVPQRRKRLIAFGSLESDVASQVESWWADNLASSPMTVRDKFADRLGVEHYYRHPRSYARRGVFSIDEPSPTVRGVNRPVPAGYPGHAGDSAPVLNSRPLTTLERAEIQTFPAGFRFVGSQTDAEQMIGNAVPVNLAKYIASGISAVLSRLQVERTATEQL